MGKKSVYDAQFDGGSLISLEKAIQIRNIENEKIKQPKINPIIKKPVSRLSLKSARNRAGGRYYAWGVLIHGKARAFSFWASGKNGEAFDQTAEYATSQGVPIKEPDMDKAFGFYLGRIKTKEFRNFINNRAAM